MTRPDTDVCVVNADLSHKKCYNLLRDYGDDGEIKPGAVAKIVPIAGVKDLDKNIATDPDGWANLKAYIRDLRDANK